MHGYLAPGAGFGDIGVLSQLRADAWSASGRTTCSLVWGSQMASNAWFTGNCTFTESFLASHVAIVLNLSGDPWSGKMFLDARTSSRFGRWSCLAEIARRSRAFGPVAALNLSFALRLRATMTSWWL